MEVAYDTWRGEGGGHLPTLQCSLSEAGCFAGSCSPALQEQLGLEREVGGKDAGLGLGWRNDAHARPRPARLAAVGSFLGNGLS